jgi:hypothetical protein
MSTSAAKHNLLNTHSAFHYIRRKNTKIAEKK